MLADRHKQIAGYFPLWSQARYIVYYTITYSQDDNGTLSLANHIWKCLSLLFDPCVLLKKLKLIMYSSLQYVGQNLDLNKNWMASYLRRQVYSYSMKMFQQHRHLTTDVSLTLSLYIIEFFNIQTRASLCLFSSKYRPWLRNAFLALTACLLIIPQT